MGLLPDGAHARLGHMKHMGGLDCLDMGRRMRALPNAKSLIVTGRETSVMRVWLPGREPCSCRVSFFSISLVLTCVGGLKSSIKCNVRDACGNRE